MRGFGCEVTLLLEGSFQGKQPCSAGSSRGEGGDYQYLVVNVSTFLMYGHEKIFSSFGRHLPRGTPEYHFQKIKCNCH